MKMSGYKNVLSVLVVTVAVLLPTLALGALNTISYQGQLSDEGIPVDGTVSFKFAIVELGGSEVTLWSNDSSSTGGSEPTTFLDLSVVNGIFQVQLGDTPMDPLPDDFLLAASDPILRVWIKGSEDPGFQALGDQDLGASPFAFRAAISDTSLTGGSGGGSSVWETSGADAYRLTGNVGIGTDTPEEPLHVSGSAKFEGSVNISDDGGFPIRFTRPGLDPWKFTQTFAGSSGVALFKDSGEVGSFWGLFLGQNGKAGFQTPTPSGRLEVFGGTPPGTTDATSPESRWLVLRNSQSSQGNHKWGIVWDRNDAATPNAYIMANGDYSTNHSTSLVFGTRPTTSGTVAIERMRIDETGDIGIGTDNPQAKLHVAGDALVGNLDALGSIQASALTVEPPGGGAVVRINGLAPQIIFGPTNGDPKIDFGNQFISGGGRLLLDADQSRLSMSNGGSVLLTAQLFTLNNSDFVVSGTGQAGINGPITSNYQLHVHGAMLASVYDQVSDARLKTDIRPIDNALSTVGKLQGVRYHWKEDVESGSSRTDYIGFLAQDVQKVLPEIVSQPDGEMMSIAYTELVPVLVEAIKDLEKLNDRQGEEIRDLTDRLSKLESATRRN